MNTNRDIPTGLSAMTAEQAEAAFDRGELTREDLQTWCDLWNASGKHFYEAFLRGNRIMLTAGGITTTATQGGAT